MVQKSPVFELSAKLHDLKIWNPDVHNVRFSNGYRFNNKDCSNIFQDVVKGMWRYIKRRKLQDPAIKTKIHCDDKLKAVAKKTFIDQNEMFALMKLHMTDV